MRYLLFLAALPLMAEVTPAHREAYFKAAAKSATINLQLVKADAELQDAVAKMAEVCKATKLIVNDKGDPICAPAPTPSPSKEKK